MLCCNHQLVPKVVLTKAGRHDADRGDLVNKLASFRLDSIEWR